MSSFKLDWVLNNELAIGRAPSKASHFEYLRLKNIKSILNLCSEEEAPANDEVKKIFTYRRYTLPDHKVHGEIKISDINNIISTIKEIKKNGAVFVHCLAARERSPIICMAWLISEHKLTPFRALDYLKEVNPRTNPLPTQFRLLKEIS